MSDVTYSTKCYTYVCAGCGKLSQSNRRDQLTCSTACRVKAHRNGSIKALRDLAVSFDISPASIVQSKAIGALRPDLAEQISRREILFADAMRETNHALITAVMAQIRGAK